MSRETGSVQEKDIKEKGMFCQSRESVCVIYFTGMALLSLAEKGVGSVRLGIAVMILATV